MSQDDEENAFADVDAQASEILLKIVPHQSVVNVTEQSEQPVPNNEATSNRVPPAPKRIRGVKKTDFVTYKLE